MAKVFNTPTYKRDHHRVWKGYKKLFPYFFVIFLYTWTFIRDVVYGEQSEDEIWILDRKRDLEVLNLVKESFFRFCWTIGGCKAFIDNKKN